MKITGGARFIAPNSTMAAQPIVIPCHDAGAGFVAPSSTIAPKANIAPLKVFVMALFMLSLLMVQPLWIHNAGADMGRIHATDAQISEESQKAIILHNLEEEVLILGTDLKADKKTGIIRFIPFPSEPRVRLAEGDPFQAASELIKKQKLMFLMVTKGGTSSRAPVEMAFHEKIGAHDITVIKVNDVSGFRTWVNAFFRDRGLPQKETYPDVEGVAEDYVKRGINYFVFDFVEVDPTSKFIEPIVYRFKSKELYYPLKTSNTFGGSGSIDLIVAAPGTLCPSPPTPYDSCSRLFGDFEFTKTSTSSEVLPSELKSIYGEAADFFKANKAVFTQLIHFSGKYEFQNDILFDLSKALPHAIGYAEEHQGSPWMLPMEDLVKDIKKQCLLKPEKGPCKALFWKYFFDPKSKTCKEFMWGGCDGVVPFETEKDCRELCE